jgi:multiple sugar transport system ATP-binding protein
MARVALAGVRKVYDNGYVAVDSASFDIGDGELMVLVGPSGCGKSTLLRMIAGLETISSGTVSIGERVVNDVPPKQRDIAMVFQNYALYPHMTVYDNMAFGLKLRNLMRADIDSRVRRAADMLGLDKVLDRKPKQLSGGQRQRVALGRALVREPAAFLLDEPLSNLDAKLRLQTRAEIAQLHQRLHATMIYVTHDQIEAMTLGDRIVVLDAGKIQQIDTPLNLYRKPANKFVAGFIGSPPMNFIDKDGVTIGIRPEHITMGSGETYKLDLVEPVGNEMFVYANRNGQNIVARIPPRDMPPIGSEIQLAFDSAHLHRFDSASGARL